MATDPRLPTQLIIIAAVMLVLMSVYEWLKQVLLPDISIWSSHIITIVFTTCVATATFYFVMKQFHEEYRMRLQEIARREAFEASLRESEEKWHSAVNNAVVGFYQVVEAGDFIMVNDKLAAILGYDSSAQLLNNIKNIKQLYVNPQERLPLIERLSVRGVTGQTEVQFKAHTGIPIWISLSARAFTAPSGDTVFEGYIIDITKRKKAEAEKERLYRELKVSMEQVRTLQGMLPICSHCKKVRDDKGYWNQLEEYISSHSDAQFSHSICPECIEKLYPEFCRNKKGDRRMHTGKASLPK